MPTTEIFNPRVSAIVFRDGKILLSRVEPDTFWALPGGRIEAGEMADRALQREVAEELGTTTAPIGRLVWVVENRFAHGAKRFYEIGFYYCVDLSKETCPACAGEFIGAEPRLRLRWFALDEIITLDLRPAFLRSRLSSLPEVIEHLQVDEL